MRFIKLAFLIQGVLIPGSLLAITEPAGPKSALAQYLSLAAANHGVPRDVVIEIDASLPKQGKWGRLRAVRHMASSGKPEYEVLGIEGDQTVRRQIIARYLTAEVTPGGSAAVTEANYRFRYIGSVGFGSELTYVFQLAPKKKRAGLFRGELWIDAATGHASHQSGRMVKMPSIFLRSIDIAQDMNPRGGVSEARITRVDIDTKMAGRAALTIREEPAL